MYRQADKQAKKRLKTGRQTKAGKQRRKHWQTDKQTEKWPKRRIERNRRRARQAKRR